MCDTAVQEVRSHSAAACQYSLTVNRPSVHVEVVGMLSHRSTVGTPQSLRFSYKLPLTSFVR